MRHAGPKSALTGVGQKKRFSGSDFD